MKFTFFSIIIFFSLTIFSQNSFTAKLNVPKEIIQGQYSEITLNIYKPQGARNFTKFTQKLPVGFFVKMKDAMGATYTYENNLLVITWLRCPEDAIFAVKYEIASMVGISGSFNIAGKLSYMVGGQQAVFDLKPQTFILVKEKTKPISKLNNNTSENKNIRYTNTKLKDVSCKREVEFNKNKNTYLVEIEIISNKKGEYNLVELIPKGFTFSQIDSHGAKVKTETNLVQYIWQDTSFAKGIKIKYQLTPKENVKGKPSFFGKLSFLKGMKIMNMVIPEK